MQPSHKFLALNDICFSYYEWGEPDRPTIFLIHATGMNARIWDKTIAAFGDGFHVIALDQRGHGLSRSDDYLLDWRIMGNDATAFIRALDLKDMIGVGHSMGGHVLTQAALDQPDRFKRLILIDPVIFSPERYKIRTEFEEGHPKDNPIARRRNHFQDWEAMREIFSKKQPYSEWDPDVLTNYCLYGVRENTEDRSVSLACAPDVEASVYMGHHSINPLDQLHEIKQPVTVLRARGRDPEAKHKIDFSASPTWDQLANQFPQGKDVWLKHLTHFIPMQDPALTAKYILEQDVRSVK